jgi:D-glycero-alpha-D-manno-heptose-7-phosphate kinase
VLCYSGAAHVSGETHARVWQRFAAGDAQVARALDGLRACAIAMRAALERGDLGETAALLNENWRCQRALVDGMQTPEMARLERVAAEAGAVGTKACGAGAGGCLVFLARGGSEFEVADALRAAGGTVLPFAFDESGVTVWEPGA